MERKNFLMKAAMTLLTVMLLSATTAWAQVPEGVVAIMTLDSDPTAAFYYESLGAAIEQLLCG